MKASILDLRRKMREILRALDRSEPVTILYRGKKGAYFSPRTGARAGEESPFRLIPRSGCGNDAPICAM
jgi:hypothetical protein